MTSGEQTVLGFSNEGLEDRAFTVRVRSVEGAPEITASRYQARTIGDPNTDTPGEAEWVEVTVDRRYAAGTLDLDLDLPSGTALSVVLNH